MWVPYCYNITSDDDMSCPGGLNVATAMGPTVVANNTIRKLVHGVDSGQPALDSYLYHLETKLEKLSARHGNNDVKNVLRQNFALKQEIEHLCRLIKPRYMPTKQSMIKNRELNFWEKH
jgi:hypothetical protein